MPLYGGIDLHSNNSVIALTDETDRIVYRKRLANDEERILEALGLDHRSGHLGHAATCWR
jgi:transposase